jgi:carbamoylphosphate synthase large subunit
MNSKQFKERFTKIEEEVDETDINQIEEKIYKLEEEINEIIGSCIPSEENALQSLLKKIARFKKENDFYDADAELDNMFPNRNDEDFDEDSMSYDSVFGKD